MGQSGANVGVQRYRTKVRLVNDNYVLLKFLPLQSSGSVSVAT